MISERGSMTIGNSDGTNQKKKKKKNLHQSVSPSICRNASNDALRREKQAKLRPGWSQHGVKSLKFHSINSIVEYAKNLFFIKQNYVNPRLVNPEIQLSMLQFALNTSPTDCAVTSQSCGSIKEQRKNM